MRGFGFPGAAVTLAWFLSWGAFAQGRSVAITVDHLPCAGGTLTASMAERVNGKLLAAFRTHHVPATGFVIQQRVESIGSPSGTGILDKWISQGFDLGNHTYSHPDINDLPLEQVEQEIVRGESILGPLLKVRGKEIEFFRFPMNHTGDTKAKHDAIAAFLAQRGYRLATCTIDNSDYLFNDAYARMLAKKDDRAARKLRPDYLAYTSAEIDYYAALNKQVFGYEPPQVTNHRLEGGGYGNGLQVLFRPKAGRMAPAPSGLQEVDGLNHLLGSPRPSPCSDRRYTLQ
jgi:peptidoglycan/xylan/chitin deacetylase (PgdA/CDA1 family)